MTARVWAILPIKSLHAAKQRLGCSLSAEQRRLLMLISARDVLTALCDCKRLAGTLVVSKDADALALAREFGVDTLAAESDHGQSDAVTRAVGHLQDRGVTATVTIPGDAPLLTAADVDCICDTLRTQPSLTLISNIDGTGTNCIGASPPDLIRYQFGHNSLLRHTHAAREADVEFSVLKLPRLELDIDTESDVAAILKQPPRTATQRFLITTGLRAAS